MALSSSSTIQDAQNQYNDNLAWEGSVGKAQNALEAARFIMANRPRIIATNNRSVNFDSIAAEKERLEVFVARFGSSVKRSSFTRGRMLVK